MLLGLLGRTWREQVVRGAERPKQLLAGPDGAGEAVIVSFWHARAPTCAWILHRHLLRHGYPAAVLVSHSRDGEIGASLARRWGASVVRGSSSRGGAQGLRNLYRAVRKGNAAITIPDGPRGPAHVVKPGTVVLAQMSGAAIQPMAVAADRCWRIRSWDRMIFPKPFARVRIAYGEPLTVPSALEEGDLERHCRRLEAALDDLVREVEAADGFRATLEPRADPGLDT